MKYLILVCMLLVAFNAYGEQKYNPMENSWETVPNDWNLKYEPIDNDWSYQPDNAQVEYNPMENQWDWNSGHNPD